MKEYCHFWQNVLKIIHLLHLQLKMFNHEGGRASANLCVVNDKWILADEMDMRQNSVFNKQSSNKKSYKSLCY